MFIMVGSVLVPVPRTSTPKREEPSFPVPESSIDYSTLESNPHTVSLEQIGTATTSEFKA